MRLDASKDLRKCRNYKLVDLETGKEIPYCIWADEETGEYECVCVDENGNAKVKLLIDGKWASYEDCVAHGLIKGNVINVKHDDSELETEIKKGFIRYMLKM